MTLDLPSLKAVCAAASEGGDKVGLDMKAIDDLRVSILDGQIKTREKCAIEYAAIIRASQWSGVSPDVAALNDAIVIRWSRSGLNFIKKRAWAMAGANP